MEPLRIYTDTSVIGGCFDRGFEAASRRMFEQARRGKLIILISAVVLREMEPAPEPVRRILDELPESQLQIVEVDDHVQRLVDRYLKAGIVSPKWRDDATHVAAASISRADAIVSWNFKHIARVDRIKAYNAVNAAYGLPPLIITSPLEVDYADED